MIMARHRLYEPEIRRQIAMDAKIRKIEKENKKEGKELKDLEKLDKKRDKFVDAGKKALKKGKR
jgi:hypothetical protein